MIQISALIACVFLIGCKSMPSPEAGAYGEAKAASSDLSLTDAKSRKARLSNIVYTLQVNIAASDKEFTGDQQIDFDLNDAKNTLRVDFFEGRTTKIELNGQVLGPETKKSFWIELPTRALKVGRNRLKITYAHNFANDGQGLHRFVDPEDKKIYLYTQFETFDANRFMPCFDQPDLRSQLKLQVIAPKDWQVFSATRETSVQKNEGTNIWNFPPTPWIATYLFSLHAGQYKIYTDHYESIPLRLMMRQSIARYVDTKEWFLVTKQGLKFFENYFGVKYPFKKYDQLIVPEFNMGGMENVAAVTYTEWVVPRSKPTREMNRRRAELLLHEMAHMWFGDLVTMSWWNDLWLNESFATIMGNMAVAEATQYKEQWQDFAAGTKRWAYTADALKTTHPIEASIKSVKEAEANFDGITYNKGASAMKQLRYYMTKPAFDRGIHTYIHEYSFKNTTLDDFISSLQGETKQDLKLWADRWLRQSGTDTVQVTWNCEGAALKKISVTMTPSPGAKFRPQALEIGLFTPKASVLKLSTKVRAELNSEKPLELSGNWECPAVVYPNVEDHGYVNVKLDEKSLQSLKTGLVKVEDPLVRSLIWNDQWRMVRNFEMSLRSFIETLNNNFPGEKDQIILRQVVSLISSSRGSVLSYWPTHTPDLIAERENFRGKMEEHFLMQIRAQATGSDEEKFWYDNYVQIAQSKKALDQLNFWLLAGRISPKFQLDLDREWAIVYSLKRFKHPSAQKALATMQKKDISDRGVKEAMSAESVTPELSVKQRWFNEMTASRDPKSLAEVQAVMDGLFPQEQWPLKVPFENSFYEFLKQNKNSEDENRVQTILYGINPLRCEKSASQRLAATLQAEKQINPALLKRMMINLEEDERCQKIRELF